MSFASDLSDYLSYLESTSPTVPSETINNSLLLRLISSQSSPALLGTLQPTVTGVATTTPSQLLPANSDRLKLVVYNSSAVDSLIVSFVDSGDLELAVYNLLPGVSLIEDDSTLVALKVVVASSANLIVYHQASVIYD